ncbi:MAG TPA: DoxX family protein [Pseudolabrys sp.]|jgi:putative oxidoreductase|nr:DoxX family protein [Pseudolabrys sp.]
MTALDRSSAAARSRAEAPLADVVILVARIMIGLIFVMSGWSKLMNFSGAVAGIAKRGVPEFIAYLAPPVEFFGGLAIMLGLFTEAAAILMVVFTIVATITSHRYWEIGDAAQYRVQNTNFWKNVTMMGGMLLLFVTAGGRYSVDALFRRR